MFWTRKPPPTKAELAKEAALNAAHSLSDRAHDFFDAIPTETVTHKWDDLRHATAERLAEAAARVTEAEKLVAEKWATTRPVVEGKAHDAAQNASDAAHKAQQEVAKRKKELEKQLHQQAKEFEKQKENLSAKHEAWKHDLAEKASAAQATAQAVAQATAAKVVRQHAEDKKAAQEFVDKKQAEAQDALEHARNNNDIIPLLEGDKDVEIEVRESGGTSIFVWLGVGLIIGALAIYFLAPGSGRRSRAAIKDRLSKVKDDLVDETTKKADGNSARIEALTGKAENKLAEVANVVADKVEDAAQTLSAKLEGAGESLAQGIETAGTGASDAAHTAAAKVDDAKHTLSERLEAAGSTPETSEAAPEITTTESPVQQSVNDVVKEAENTVESIEAAARKKKPKTGA